MIVQVRSSSFYRSSERSSKDTQIKSRRSLAGGRTKGIASAGSVESRGLNMRMAQSPQFTALVAVAALLFGHQSSAQDSNEPERSASVVFVCEHGSVKSLIAASLFDQVAKRRGLPFRARSRGVSPDAHVPEVIVAALRNEGVEVETFKPQPLSLADIDGAARVIAIGVDLAAFGDRRRMSIDEWNDVPAASVDYPKARAALLHHIETLIDELASNR
jgi:arsenate reductase (thioredoxin)